MDAGGERDLERAELIGPVGLDLDRLPGEAVQSHQGDQRVRSVGRAAEAAGDRRRVDGVVEMGVADEHAGDLSRRLHEAVERDRVRQGRPAQQQAAERDPGEVGVDEERLALVGEPVARDAEPFDLEALRQSRRALPRARPAPGRLRVRRRASSPAPGRVRRDGGGVSARRRIRRPRAPPRVVGESRGSGRRRSSARSASAASPAAPRRRRRRDRR